MGLIFTLIVLGFLAYVIGQKGVWNVVKNVFKGCLGMVFIFFIAIIALAVFAYIVLR